ncbi:MAG: TIGR01777 family oxidoreductase [Pirellulaceae bacterium]|nr:TIGR01777 family oxidoreductase [Pirellulaceae bacterium]
MRALVTGATGFVGQRLLGKLTKPVVLSRDPGKAEKSLAKFGVKAYAWEPQEKPAPAEAFDGIDAIFHLAGDPVAEGRWTAAKKERIRASRELGTRNLVTTLRALTHRPKVLVSASAVGIYGNRGAEELDEHSSHASDYLAEVCEVWEREAVAARELGMRVVPVRVGIVLGEKGGALGKMLTPFKLGVGSPLGSGQQYMPWIHIDDLVGILLHAAASDSLNETLNGTAPHPATNREFTKTLGKVLGRPTFFPPVPGFVLRTALGEFANVLLASQRVLPKATLASGYHFQHAELEMALRSILNR